MSGEWSVKFRSEGHDTRRYKRKSLKVFGGYEQLPVIDDRLPFVFPEGRCQSSRIVSLTEDEDELLSPERALELWSPNSARKPFYPGLNPELGHIVPPLPFVDGHQGRFDPTRNPQYFDPNQPYLPFLRRADKGSTNAEEVECVPLYAVWECSSFPGDNKGYVQDEYWDSLIERAENLRRRARNRRDARNCSTFTGFINSCPGSSAIERNSRFPGRMDFEDMVQLLSGVQNELRLLAAWVRMADALISAPFSDFHKMTDDLSPWDSNNSLVGLWINGTLESTAAWFVRLGVPVFVCHEIKGIPDKPNPREGSVWVNNALDSCELRDSIILDEWSRLYRRTNLDEGDTWDGGYEPTTHLSMDKLERWRSSSRATRSNFPGEDWGEVTEIPMEVEDDPLLPQRPSIATPPPGYEPYIIPPPVQPANINARIRHYVEDHNDQGERCFKYTSQSDLYESYDVTYVDQPNRRYLHMDSRLFILPEIVHPVEVYGLPGPRLKFYDDFHCQKENPHPDDVGKSAPTPSTERLRPSASYTTSEESHPEVPRSDVDSTPCEDGKLDIPHMVTSVIPGQTPACTWNVSPFVRIGGVEQINVQEFRDWLVAEAPTLRLAMAIRSLYHVDEDGKEIALVAVLYLKFWNRRHAASFWEAFQNREIMGYHMVIQGAKLQEVKHIKLVDVLEYWECSTKPGPWAKRLGDRIKLSGATPATLKTTLLQRLNDTPSTSKLALGDRLTDCPGKSKRKKVDDGTVPDDTKDGGSEEGHEQAQEELMGQTRRGDEHGKGSNDVSGKWHEKGLLAHGGAL
ncbi:hypothetical protein C8R42DRAFT_637399 [Lentinula raphanica]|nr:hypothetical protein C8R42DRAFT_637399 [Lentinula raphanica]